MEASAGTAVLMRARDRRPSGLETLAWFVLAALAFAALIYVQTGGH